MSNGHTDMGAKGGSSVHSFGEWVYRGMGNSERICERCGYRQDGLQPDNDIPGCSTANSGYPQNGSGDSA